MAPACLQVVNHSVADGRWHSVSLEVNGTTLRLTVDASHTNSSILPQPCKLTQSGGALMLANSNPSTDALRPGFSGCLESLEFNGEAVRKEEGMASFGPQSGRLFGIYQCCSGVKSCASNPCGNGGACVEDSSGGENKALLLWDKGCTKIDLCLLFVCTGCFHCFTICVKTIACQSKKSAECLYAAFPYLANISCISNFCFHYCCMSYNYLKENITSLS